MCTVSFKTELIMAYICYDKLWRSELYNNLSAKDRVPDINLIQIKLKVNDTYKTDRKLTTKFKPSKDEDVANKAYLNSEVSKVQNHRTYIEKDYNELKLRNDKQSEEILVEKAVKPIFQTLYDNGLFDKKDNANEILKDYLFIEVNGRRTPDLEEVKDYVVIQ